MGNKTGCRAWLRCSLCALPVPHAAAINGAVDTAHPRPAPAVLPVAARAVGSRDGSRLGPRSTATVHLELGTGGSFTGAGCCQPWPFWALCVFGSYSVRDPLHSAILLQAVPGQLLSLPAVFCALRSLLACILCTAHPISRLQTKGRQLIDGTLDCVLELGAKLVHTCVRVQTL